ncbi:biopolymer transporter ExbD [bacterium]|nr:biopolymer transporter ExbD [bacterium]
MKLQRRKLKLLKLDLTPLIDVVFLLLIFFMVSTSFIKLNQSITLNLPKAENGVDQPATGTISIAIDKSNKLYFAGIEVKIEQITEKLKASKKLPVIIEADSNSSHGTVIEIIDLVKKFGISDFTIATVSKKA